MPTQSEDPITSALQMSLTSAKKCKNGEELDLAVVPEQVLSSEIKYEKTKFLNTSVLNYLKGKYITLSTLQSSKCDEVSTNKDIVNSEKSACDQLSKKALSNVKESITLPTPKRVLYSPDAVRLGWPVPQAPVGSGFVNLGNSCYLNSSLQALFHVPAFVNWLSSDTNHSSKCESMNGMTHSECLICAMSKTLHSSQKCTGSVVKPLQIYTKLKLICKHLVHGHQEDAHEFLRYLIEGMERSYLQIFNGVKLDSYSKETTPLNQIFGGYLRSEVTCLECQHVSTTFQHFQDLLLDIRTASSVDDALDSYFSRERLGDGDQAYRCEQCKKRVAAAKKFTIERPPKALCIALKRFGGMGGKNSKTISLKQMLDISKFRHRPSPQPLQYKLVAMVSHLGPTASCGHYTAVGQAATGTYYLFDDNHVRPLPLQNVLSSNPYILLYEMEIESKRQQVLPKKETLSNGFVNSNGLSSSNVESKINTPSSSSVSNSSASTSSVATSSSSEPRPSQNGLQNNTSRENFKIVYLGKPKVESQAGPSYSPKPTQEQHQPYCQNKLNSLRAFQYKKSVTITVPKPSVTLDKGLTKTSESLLPGTSVKQSAEDLLPPEKIPNKLRECNVNKTPIATVPEKKVEDKTFANPEEELKSSPTFGSLVPYLSESSESEGEFVPPKPSTAKESSKATGSKLNERSSSLSKPKGVRIEIEGLELNQSQSISNRTDLHSPAGSTSSGKWSVTSLDRDRTPEKQDKSSPAENEKNDRIPNGGSTNGGDKCERWDGNRNNGSVVDQLMKTSHRGYGAPVNSWNGGRSEMDLHMESERNYLKRSHDPYNDEFDRGKVKKLKKYSNKDNSNGNGRNRFQEYQNRNSWKGNQRQKFYRDYVDRGQKQQRYYPSSRKHWGD